MKLKFTISLLLLVNTIPILANFKQDKFDYDKFKAEKIAFITEAIDLTPEEAEIFWPVYNEYEKKKWKLMSDRRELDQSLKEGVKDMTDKEYIELSRKLAAFQINDGKLNEEYNEKFLKILPPKKVVELYLAEHNFRNHLLRNYRDNDQKNDEKEK